jgi:hypothetical protein
MFKVVSQPTFTHPVDVLVPTDGGHEKQTFKATFRVLADADSDDDRHDLNSTAGSTAFLREVIVSLSDLAGDDDQPLPYNDGLRDRLLKVPYIRAALARTYFTAINKAAVGN